MMARWAAPAIVTVVAIVGAHPFCNLAFRCGCGLVTLTAHCNIHAPTPPHCPWCATPRWFALAALFGVVAATAAMRLMRRRGPGLWAEAAAGVGGLVVGASVAVLITKLVLGA